MKEISPSAARVAAIHNPDNPITSAHVRSVEMAGSKLGMQVVGQPARNAEEFERTIGDFAAEPNGALLVLLDFVTLAHRDLIIKLAAQHRLPAGYNLRVFTVDGGLISYGVDAVDLYRRGASYIDRILKGEKPADLPVQAPTKYELVINLKTAKALGLTVRSPAPMR